MNIVIAVFASLAVIEAKGAIQYTGFGPTTLSTSNGQVDVPNFFGAPLSFIWAQLATTRQGQIAWDREELTGEQINISVLATTTSTSPADNLSEGELISSAATWRNSVLTQSIYSFNQNT